MKLYFILVIVLLISVYPLACKEIAYAVGPDGEKPIIQANITEYKGTDVVSFTVSASPRGPSTSYKGQRTVDSIKEEINKKVDRGNELVRDEGLSLVGKRSGAQRIDQICSIYDYMVGNWTFVSDWSGLDVFQYSNYTLRKGSEVGTSGKGDCDDFSILLASLIESIGGTPRIIFAYSPAGGHAYTEVYIGKSNSKDLDRMMRWLRTTYNANDVNIHADLENGDVWLNMDWWKDSVGAKHPGGPFYQATAQIPVYTLETKAALTPVENMLPLVLFNYTPIQPEVGEMVSFDASQSIDRNGRIVDYGWDFGDGDTLHSSSKSESSHVYLSSGYFQVNLTVTDNDGDKSCETVDINVTEPLPTAIGTYLPIDPHVDEIIAFDATRSKDDAGKITEYEWDFGDGYAGKRALFKHQFSEIGTYSVALTVTNDKGRKNTSIIIVVVKPKEVPTPTNAGLTSGGSSNSSTASSNPIESSNESKKIQSENEKQRSTILNETAPSSSALVKGTMPAPADKVVIRGAIAGTVDGMSNFMDDSFTWNPQNFAGFFYDIKRDIGTESLRTVPSFDDGLKLSGNAPYGITYTTSVHSKAYEQALWGGFNIIAFQGEQYFAGYLQGSDWADGSNLFYAETTDKNSLASVQLEKILMNSKDEMTIVSGIPLKLGEGYELNIKSINVDDNSLNIELSKNNKVVDSKTLYPSKEDATELDKAYYYKNPQVGRQKDLVTIGIHFINAFRAVNQSLASIDGIWQISDTPTEVKVETKYGKMTITEINATTGVITMNNRDEPIYLTKNKDTMFMPGVSIKAADNDTLRFYIYKLITEPGTYALRGAVAGTVQGASNIVDNYFRWNPQNFAGFFYDIKKDLGNEFLKAVITGDVVNTGGKLSGDPPYGLTYSTTAQSKAYERTLWGAYQILGFLGDKYFAGYNQGSIEQDGSSIFCDESTDDNSLAKGQLEQILIDSKDEKTIGSGAPLKLREGYELNIKSINIDDNSLNIELSKNNKVVDSQTLYPSKEDATEQDKTYYYKNPQVGRQKKLVTIGVHFRNVFRAVNQSLATIDGIWQISDTPTEVKVETKYNKMTIAESNATTGVITMDNRDEPISLKKNMNTVLIPGIYIKTADNYTLRFYIYRPVTF